MSEATQMSLRYTQPKDPPRSQHASSLLKESSQPASPSVVSPASGRELKEGSQLSRGVLRPMFQQTPLVLLSQHPAEQARGAYRSTRGKSAAQSAVAVRRRLTAIFAHPDFSLRALLCPS